MTEIKMTTKINEVFTIELDENPTTGYAWVLSALPSNIYLVNDSYTVDLEISNAFGRGGKRTFVFKAVGEAKECHIQFRKMRVWENSCIEETTYCICVDHAIRYERITDYFVKNTFRKGNAYLLIDNYQDFTKVFGAAAIMAPQRWIHEQDFTNNIVVAVITESMTDIPSFQVEKVIESGRELQVYYSEHVLPVLPPFISRSCMILLVEKANYNQVAFYVANQQKAQVALNEKQLVE